MVPPCFELDPDPDFLPPWLEASGLLAIRAARDFDMPLSFSASYWFSFLMLRDLDGIASPPQCKRLPICRFPYFKSANPNAAVTCSFGDDHRDPPQLEVLRAGHAWCTDGGAG